MILDSRYISEKKDRDKNSVELTQREGIGREQHGQQEEWKRKIRGRGGQ